MRAEWGDQEVWVALFSQRNRSADRAGPRGRAGAVVYELPSGYNFRWHWPMTPEEKCKVHVVHGWFSTSHSPRLIAEHDKSCLRVAAAPGRRFA